MEQNNPPLLRVLMLPWLAHGHVSPFLELAKRIARRNIHVYLCSTPINLSAFQDRFEPGIEPIELHLPNLPPHLHTNLPIHLNSSLTNAFDSVQPSFSDILSTLNPDCIIHEPLQPWPPLSAHQQNIPAILFLVNSAASYTSLLYHAMACQNIIPFPFPGFKMELPEGKIHELSEKFKLSFQRSSNICAIKTCTYIESDFIDYLSFLIGKEMVPVGLLDRQVPSRFLIENQPCMIMEWLDKKPSQSVVFVSFGTEYFMSEQELEEIAMGLELSGQYFIWVVEFPKDGKEPKKIEEVLPSGFLERVGEKGMVVMGWVEQMQILSQRSIGGFLTDCGWNGTLEGLRFGVPLIVLPLQYDQPANARLVVWEWGVGVEIEREMSGNLSFKREKVAKAIGMVMVEKQGEVVRMAAKRMGECLRCKGEEEVDVFVERLVEICKGSGNKEEMVVEICKRDW